LQQIFKNREFNHSKNCSEFLRGANHRLKICVAQNNRHHENVGKFWQNLCALVLRNIVQHIAPEI